jgi:malate dehydrogenase (oxaloacetate-decarboxylating)
MRGADVFIGVSVANILTPAMIKSMGTEPIVFAMANPTPEGAPEMLSQYARVVATGRSDYPNQINNVLAFPGIFRGALDAQAREITPGMRLAAAKAIATTIPPDAVSSDYIVPSVFNRDVVPRVAAAVAEAAVAEGVIREDALALAV